MLAALIATRTPPTPPPITYGDQFVASTTTFTCMFLAKQAAALTTNPAVAAQLAFSRQGLTGVIDQLTNLYVQVSGPTAGTDPAYLSNTIIAIIAVATTLQGIINSLPVAANNQQTLLAMQSRMSVAIRALYSLAIPINLDFS
jgi:hypothetical protein